MAGPHGALSDGRVGDARTAPMGRTYVVLLKVRFKPSLNCNLSRAAARLAGLSIGVSRRNKVIPAFRLLTSFI